MFWKIWKQRKWLILLMNIWPAIMAVIETYKLARADGEVTKEEQLTIAEACMVALTELVLGI